MNRFQVSLSRDSHLPPHIREDYDTRPEAVLAVGHHVALALLKGEYLAVQLLEYIPDGNGFGDSVRVDVREFQIVRPDWA